MRDVKDQYTREMADHFGGYFAAWTPGDPVSLGDVGVLEGKAFRKIGTIKDALGVTFDVVPDTSQETIGPYKTSGKVSIAFKAKGAATLPNSTLAQTDAGFAIQFADEHALVFLAENCLQPSIRDQISLGRVVIKAFKAGNWSKSWHVVTQVVESVSATVLISASSRSSIDLKVSASVSPTPGTADLANADLGLQVESAHNMGTVLVAKGATPLFKLSAMKKPLVGKPRFDALGLVPNADKHLLRLPLDAVTPGLLKKHPALANRISFGEVR